MQRMLRFKGLLIATLLVGLGSAGAGDAGDKVEALAQLASELGGREALESVDFKNHRSLLENYLADLARCSQSLKDTLATPWTTANAAAVQEGIRNDFQAIRAVSDHIKEEHSRMLNFAVMLPGKTADAHRMSYQSWAGTALEKSEQLSGLRFLPKEGAPLGTLRLDKSISEGVYDAVDDLAASCQSILARTVFDQRLEAEDLNNQVRNGMTHAYEMLTPLAPPWLVEALPELAGHRAALVYPPRILEEALKPARPALQALAERADEQVRVMSERLDEIQRNLEHFVSIEQRLVEEIEEMQRTPPQVLGEALPPEPGPVVPPDPPPRPPREEVSAVLETPPPQVLGEALPPDPGPVVPPDPPPRPPREEVSAVLEGPPPLPSYDPDSKGRGGQRADRGKGKLKGFR